MKSNGIVQADLFEIVSFNLPWEQFSGCKIVVTGAAGFLGNYIVRTLLSLNQLKKVSKPLKIVAMVRNIEYAKEQFDDIMCNNSIDLQYWDLNTIGVPELGAVNYVIHAGSQASPRFYGSDPVGTALPNSIGTASLLEALKRSPDPRGFLFISSSEVYGSVETDLSIEEDHIGWLDPAVIRSCYAESKRFGEALCVAWYDQYKIPTSIARPFHTYGPGLKANDGRVFADFAFNIIRSENISMKSDGKARRAFCYVSDAITGFMAVLLKGQHAFPYNVANPDGELSVKELAELLINLYPEKKLAIDYKTPQLKSNYLHSPINRLLPNVSRLKSLGWKAHIDPATGFRRMIGAYTE